MPPKKKAAKAEAKGKAKAKAKAEAEAEAKVVAPEEEVEEAKAEDVEMKEEAEEAQVGEEATKEDTKDEAKEEAEDIPKEEKEEEKVKEVKEELEMDAPEDSRARVDSKEVGLDMSGATPNVMPAADGRTSRLNGCADGALPLVSQARNVILAKTQLCRTMSKRSIIAQLTVATQPSRAVVCNVLVSGSFGSSSRRLLMALNDGGLQYLMAGVRSNVGLKAGRYMFEVKIVEFLDPYEGAQQSGGSRAPRQLLRVGYSVKPEGPLLENTKEGQVFVDNLGLMSIPGSKVKVASRLGRNEVLGVLLNLDEKGANANTISFFKDGQRLCPPQALPANMLGQALFPTISYKNVTVHVNFGSKPRSPLPFVCRMLQDASAEDVEMTVAEEPKDGKQEVVFPIGVPDQGIFDFVDQYLAENPRHTELSERKALEWACRSGLYRPKGWSFRNSQDKPGMAFGIPLLDDGSVHTVLQAAAPALRRDLVVMELGNNLLAAERKQALRRFPSTDYKRVALVAMGEPSASYKAKVQQLVLADKVAAAKREKTMKLEEAARKKSTNRWQGKEEGDDAKKAVAEEDEKKAEGDGAQDEEMKAAEEKQEEEEVIAELSEEEKAQWFRKLSAPDLSPSILAKTFADFSIPGADEGFDEIRFVWQEAGACDKLLKDWVLEHKKTQRIEDLEPSSWFKDKLAEWHKQLQEWKKKGAEAREVAKKQTQTKRSDEAEKKEETEKKETDGGDDNAEGEGGGKAKDDAEILDEDLDVFEVADVCDIGGGRPLFLNFVYEDWTLLFLRYELHLLIHAFRHDVADPDRLSFHESHLEFYFNKYYKKRWHLDHFGVKTNDELIDLIKDSVSIDKDSRFLKTLLPEEEPLDKFVRFAEEHRRDRQRCIDAGDETAVLRFSRPAPPPRPPQGQGQSQGQGHDGYRGGAKGDKGGSKGGGKRDVGVSRAGPPQPPPHGGDRRGVGSGGAAAGGGVQYQRAGGGGGKATGRDEWQGNNRDTSQRNTSAQQSRGYGSSSGGSGSRGGYGFAPTCQRRK
ncbi:unnamed protein product [Polarella glacialis]|uniref:Uncharacterized protein n=1 Tax=Polarella glacialis TaxID=89957 RepID=A0A813LU91_POLGL|nr:unnamed protein product [Polarella glacialis]